MQLSGFHHLTAVTAEIARNHAFYTATLGLRLVKKSVNQDDVSAYHLFYADGRGTPGTDITFFDWPVPPERRGTHSVVRSGFRVSSRAAVEWWRGRLALQGVRLEAPVERDGRLVMDFEDGEGQRLCLVEDPGESAPFHPWLESPVPAEMQLRGLASIVVSVPRLAPTERVLTGVMNMTHVRSYGVPGAQEARVYSMGRGGPAAELHVWVQPGLPPARPGAGGVHHVAFRTTSAEYTLWVDRLGSLGVPSSGPVDRYYFRSLYFREPNGILFEIATDEPGFTADEPEATLGRRLALPPFLEPRRPEIERGLKPLE